MNYLMHGSLLTSRFSARLAEARYAMLLPMAGNESSEDQGERREESEPGVPGLSSKLEHLFAVVPRPDGGRYTNETASQALAAAGVRVSSVHLSHLRSGRRNNPSARLLAAISTLFGVDIGYFFNAAVEEKANAELAALRSLSDSGVQGVMMRSGVSDKNLRHIDAILSAIREDIEREQQQKRESGE